MNTELKTILKLLLPEFLIDHFQITKIQDKDQRIDIYLE